jgi:sarcosine oxidase subunit alpha
LGDVKKVENNRIAAHPILAWKRDNTVHVTYDGNPIAAYPEETVAMALYAAGVKQYSTSARFYRPRGMFCAIGKCSSCMMRVDGIPNTRTCIVQVQDGMQIETQHGDGRFPDVQAALGAVQERTAEVLVIGGGPAGLEAALWAAKSGATVTLVDQNPELGGQLVKQTHKFFGSARENAGTRGITIAKQLVQEVRSNAAVTVFSGTTAFGWYQGAVAAFDQQRALLFHPRKVIIATGAAEKMLMFRNNDLPGVFGAGAAQTLMNVYGIKPGNKVLMVGAGNVGLIVSYQLMQAGILVVGVIEGAPRVGGYLVHASKIARNGVPIMTRHTVLEAVGTDHVEAAIIALVDDAWQPVPGSEQRVECDTICLSAGLKPSTELLEQAKLDLVYTGELGGWVAKRNWAMRTSNPDIFAAGDASGVEEASTAMMEGKIAGLQAAYDLGHDGVALAEQRETRHNLDELRAGPFGAKICAGLKCVEVLE